VFVPYTTAELTVKKLIFAVDAVKFDMYTFPSPVYETFDVAPATPDETR
jgi:hypothetical protein